MITHKLREPILCAVSGGVDSMYLLCRLREEGYAVAAAHFNHGLRGAEAQRDEEFVRAFCAREGIAFYAGRGDVREYAAAEGLSIEDAARELRYAFLEQTAERIDAGCIATAHNAEDNAETLLLRLTRGTGLRGLGGIPPQRGRIVRPLLDEHRAEAEAWLAVRGIEHVEDSTNASDDYARNRVRHAVMPVLRELNAGCVSNMARTARLLREDEKFFQTLAGEHIARHGADAKALAALPKPLAARVLMRLAGGFLSERHVEALLHIAREGGAADIPGHRVQRQGGVLVFDPITPQPFAERELPEGESDLPEAGLRIRREDLEGSGEVHTAFNIFYFSRNAICGKISLSVRRAGDRMRPLGRGCTKSLKQLFEEQCVPPEARAAWPLLRDEAGVIAVYGLGVAERVAVGPETKERIRVEFLPCEGKESEL